MFAGFSKTTISALYTMDYEKTNYDLIVTVLEWIVTGKHEVTVVVYLLLIHVVIYYRPVISCHR